MSKPSFPWTGRARTGSRSSLWYGVVALPPARVTAQLRRLQEELAIPGSEPQPHLTLKMPFRLRASLAEVKRGIVQVASQTASISVALGGVDSFPGPFSNTIYLAVEPNPALQVLHARLVGTLGDGIENIYPYTDQVELTNYVPHITIASDLSDEEYARLVRLLRGSKVKEQFWITEVDLRRRGTDSLWRIAQVFALDGPGRARPRQAFSSAPVGKG